MLQRWLARWHLWKEALAGMDDPQGESLLNLDDRVRRVEAKVEQLRKPSSVDAGPDDKGGNLQVAETEGKGQ